MTLYVKQLPIMSPSVSLRLHALAPVLTPFFSFPHIYISVQASFSRPSAVPAKPGLAFPFHNRQELVRVTNKIQHDYTMTLLVRLKGLCGFCFNPIPPVFLRGKQPWTVPWRPSYHCYTNVLWKLSLWTKSSLQRTQAQLTGRLEHLKPALFLNSWTCEMFLVPSYKIWD